MNPGFHCTGQMADRVWRHVGERQCLKGYFKNLTGYRLQVSLLKM